MVQHARQGAHRGNCAPPHERQRLASCLWRCVTSQGQSGTRPSSAMSAFRWVPSVLPISPRCHKASRTKAWILR
ncbi:hypothetical protein CDEST_05526 [Colletotrichum destructivum]|uniref:Uncharacterized protein n=1 Tax=Colletotrichum destructivum TaxID=34406 RepID=A0AAX4IB14_9PEZI|nr:hypothetical protein CDEST_05526 [Colletotrichum destructivum]